MEAFRVTHPGILTTIQDVGRPNAVASGVPAGGAMDRFAHAAANLIVGNDRGAATLECTLTGPRLAAISPCVIAITGGDLGASIPMWTAVELAAGDEVSFAGRRIGARSYIAVSGGVVGDRWLGSMSTNLMCARGGMHGRALVPGDVISAGEWHDPPVAGRTLGQQLRPDYADRSLRVIRGPHYTRLTHESQQELWSTTFTVNP